MTPKRGSSKRSYLIRLIAGLGMMIAGGVLLVVLQRFP